MMLFSALVFLSVFAATAQAGKRGLAWPWFNAQLNPGVFNNGDGEVVAIYDWETYAPPSTNGNGGLSFIGMQRCLNCSSSPIDELNARWKAQGWETVFTLNEPDINGISPDDAASWYINNINPLTIKRALPAVTSSTAPGQGLSWVSQMITACAGQCYFDYINVHWYGASFAQFQSFIQSAYAQFPNYQLVITEFALQNPPGGQADQVTFFKQAFAFLDSAAYVALYFPFVATSPKLMEENGATPSETTSCLYNNDKTPSAVGYLMF
ncbi:hypothetical protein OG21DRAFT_1508275 [Imleria badia]|nr:hypothetical protein OG21DRAFT_1508275 [Imleria badia]